MIHDSRNKNTHTSPRGFTLIELIVSISIFAMMTALVVAKYGNFNQSVLLTNLAYDMALTIRTAQTYGVSVRQTGTDFKYPYGVYFSSDAGNNTSFVFFADGDLLPEDLGIYEGGVDDIVLNTYTLKRGAKIQAICAGASPQSCTSKSAISITYKRPDPDARICYTYCPDKLPQYARVTIEGTDGSTRAVVVRKNGQISVEE